MSKIKLFFIINALLILSCKDIHQVIPNIPVNIILDTTTDLAQLGIGSTMICPKSGGNMGIIIFRNGIDEYYAFDRLCTYYPNDTSAIVAKDGGVIATCLHCGSTFIFTADGTLVNKGPAKLPLKQYQTTLQGTRLFISN